MKIDVTNDCFAGKRGDGRIFVAPPVIAGLTAEQARRLAAWLIVLTDGAAGPAVPEIVAAIENA